MGGARSTHGEMRNAYKILVGRPEFNAPKIRSPLSIKRTTLSRQQAVLIPLFFLNLVTVSTYLTVNNRFEKHRNRNNTTAIITVNIQYTSETYHDLSQCKPCTSFFLISNSTQTGYEKGSIILQGKVMLEKNHSTNILNNTQSERRLCKRLRWRPWMIFIVHHEICKISLT
jgi:spore germination protein YaaH